MSRLKPDERYKQLLQSAVEVTKEHGFNNMTHALVALKAGVSKATVFNYFKRIDDLRNNVMQYAVKNELLSIIAEGVIDKNEIALSIAPELKKQALASVI